MPPLRGHVIETETKKGAKWVIAEKRPSYRGVQNFARPSVRPSVRPRVFCVFNVRPRVFFMFSMSVRVFFNVRPSVSLRTTPKKQKIRNDQNEKL